MGFASHIFQTGFIIQVIIAPPFNLHPTARSHPLMHSLCLATYPVRLHKQSLDLPCNPSCATTQTEPRPALQPILCDYTNRASSLASPCAPCPLPHFGLPLASLWPLASLASPCAPVQLLVREQRFVPRLTLRPSSATSSGSFWPS